MHDRPRAAPGSWRCTLRDASCGRPGGRPRMGGQPPAAARGQPLGGSAHRPRAGARTCAQATARATSWPASCDSSCSRRGATCALNWTRKARFAAEGWCTGVGAALAHTAVPAALHSEEHGAVISACASSRIGARPRERKVAARVRWCCSPLFPARRPGPERVHEGAWLENSIDRAQRGPAGFRRRRRWRSGAQRSRVDARPLGQFDRQPPGCCSSSDPSGSLPDCKHAAVHLVPGSHRLNCPRLDRQRSLVAPSGLLQLLSRVVSQRGAGVRLLLAADVRRHGWAGLWWQQQRRRRSTDAGADDRAACKEPGRCTSPAMPLLLACGRSSVLAPPPASNACTNHHG